MARIEALKMFYEEGNSEKIGDVVRELYKHIDKGPFSRNEFESIGILFGFYDKWCTLCANGYLPIWVFRGNPGHHLVVFYEYTKTYISERRGLIALGYNNPNYAIAIEEVYLKVKKKYKQ